MRRLLILAAFSATGCTGHPRAPKSADSTAAAPPAIRTNRTMYVARGTSEGKTWKIEIYEDGIRLTDSSRPAVVFPPGRVDGNDSASIWTAKRQGTAPNTLNLALIRMNCSDGHSDTVFPYKAAVILDGAQRMGCATGGPPRPAPRAGGAAPHQP